MRTVAMINQKGGVGKTTTVANLAYGLAGCGLDIGAIDLDPQSHLTMHLGIEPGDSGPGTYEVLTGQARAADAVVAVQPHLWLIPASIDLAGAEIELAAVVGREQLLADRLAEESLPYDYLLVDCPPSLGLLTLNALAAADEVLIPLQPHFLALQGLGKLLETVALVQRCINSRLQIGGVVLCMFESNTRLAAEITEDVETFLAEQKNLDVPWAGAQLFRTRIRRNIKLAESPSFGQTIFAYAPHSHGASDYRALTEEFLAVHGHHVGSEVPGEDVRPPEPADVQSPDASLDVSCQGEESTPAPVAPAEGSDRIGADAWHQASASAEDATA